MPDDRMIHSSDIAMTEKPVTTSMRKRWHNPFVHSNWFASFTRWRIAIISNSAEEKTSSFLALLLECGPHVLEKFATLIRHQGSPRSCRKHRISSQQKCHSLELMMQGTLFETSVNSLKRHSANACTSNEPLIPDLVFRVGLNHETVKERCSEPKEEKGEGGGSFWCPAGAAIFSFFLSGLNPELKEWRVSNPERRGRGVQIQGDGGVWNCHDANAYEVCERFALVMTRVLNTTSTHTSEIPESSQRTSVSLQRWPGAACRPKNSTSTQKSSSCIPCMFLACAYCGRRWDTHLLRNRFWWGSGQKSRGFKKDKATRNRTTTEPHPSSPAPIPPPSALQKKPGNKFPHTRKHFEILPPLPSLLPPDPHTQTNTPHTHHTHTRNHKPLEHPKLSKPRTRNPQSKNPTPPSSLCLLSPFPPLPFPFPPSPSSTTPLPPPHSSIPSPSILPPPPSCPAIPVRYRLEGPVHKRTVLFLVTFEHLVTLSDNRLAMRGCKDGWVNMGEWDSGWVEHASSCGDSWSVSMNICNHVMSLTDDPNSSMFEKRQTRIMSHTACVTRSISIWREFYFSWCHKIWHKN